MKIKADTMYQIANNQFDKKYKQWYKRILKQIYKHSKEGLFEFSFSNLSTGFTDLLERDLKDLGFLVEIETINPYRDNIHIGWHKNT